MNRRIFFNYVRNAPFGGRLLTKQVEGLNFILDEWGRSGLSDDRWLAYMLATTFWETAKTMQPVRERGGASYFRRYEGRADLGNNRPGDGVKYHGRGFVQITGKENYTKASRLVGEDLVANPDLAMRPDIAAKIMFSGMVDGWFTGRKLADYFSDRNDDPRQARRIINRLDKADLIAGYHQQFLSAIKAAKLEAPDVSPGRATERRAEPDDVPPAKSPSIWTILLGWLTGGALTFPNIDNPYGLAAFMALLVAGGVFGWLVLSGRLQIMRGGET